MTKNVNKFSIREAIVFGEKQFKKFWFPLFSIIALGILIEVAPFMYSLAVDNQLGTSADGVYAWYTFMGFIFSVIVMIVTVIMHFNIVKAFISAAENKEIDMMHLFHFDSSKTLQVMKFIIASIVYEVIVVIGLIFFVFPGMILATRFGFAIYLIVENNTDIIEAFKQSWHMTRGHTIDLMKFFIAAFVVASAATVVGLMLFFIGVLPVILTVFSILTIAHIHIYRHLQGRSL